MSFDAFIKSQMFKKRSENLLKLGVNFDGDPNAEFKKLQKRISDLYLIRGESMLTIMKLFDIPSTKTMHNLFVLIDLQPRTLSEANTNALMSGRAQQAASPHFVSKQQWHNTWDGNLVFIRSSYELEYALHLDAQKIKYETESLRITYYDTKEQRYRIAIPDFYLPESGTIVEIKANYWYDSTNMRDKFARYIELGYTPKLILDKQECLVGPEGTAPSFSV